MFARKRVDVFIHLPMLLLFSLGVFANAHALSLTEEDYELKLLGKFVFFDNISSPKVQSCSSCHAPRTGGTGNSSVVNQTQVAINGANPHTVGSLKPPTNTYATLIAPFKLNPTPRRGARTNDTCPGPGGFCGGNFWNGRAIGFGGDQQMNKTTGVTTSTHIITDVVIPDGLLERYSQYLGPTADQAMNPFPNDVEQNVPVSEDEELGNGLRGAEAVCRHVKKSKYGIMYNLAWGEPIDCSTEGSPRAVDISFQRIALALSAYQGSSELNSFSSKRDWALRAELACLEGRHGEFGKYYSSKICNQKDPENWGKFPLVGFSDEENWGHDLFYGMTSELNPEGKNAQCTECHVTNKEVGIHTGSFDGDGNEFIIADGTDPFERYTDDSYHSIGTPRNPEITNPECPAGSTTDSCRAGLGGHIWQDGNRGPLSVGNRKVPTLRNVDKRPYPGFVKAYGANGWFKSLESIIHFYNTATVDFNCVIVPGVEDCTDVRDTNIPGSVTEVAYEELTASTFGVTRCEDREEGWTEAQALAANCWPRPEFAAGPGAFVGNLGLNAEEEAALVAYMKTFTDRVTARPPQAYELFLAKMKNRAMQRHR